MACFAAGWGSTSMPTSCCTLQVLEPTAGRQLRNIVYADHTSRCSGRTAAVLAPESSRNTIRCYTYALHSCLRATHALLLAVPCALRSHRLGSSCSRRHSRRSPFGTVVR